MTPERWQEVKEALAAALALDEAERSAYLATMAATDAELHGEVAGLLAYGPADGFLEQPAVPTPRLGSGTAFGAYDINSRLGEGGMGVVFLGRDRTLDRPVALKFLSDVLERQPDARRRFLLEAKAAAALDHPYICKIYQTGEESGRPFIAMEYVRGETLKERIAAQPMALKEVLRITLEVAEAIETAHAAGIVHRDVKPSNIMLTTGGHVKVLDFGLAKHVGTGDAPTQTHADLTASGTVRGTVAYMSPEQVRGHEVDSRSDIFSLGVVLYEALTGKNPFHAGSPLETASEILHHVPPEPGRVRGDIPPLLDYIVQKMLAKGPDDRYQLVHELRTDLARVSEAAGRADPVSPGAVVGQAPGTSTAETAAMKPFLGVARRRSVHIGLAAAALAAILTVSLWPKPGVLSVVVLPPTNLSGDSDLDYLANGIAQAITTRLHNLHNIGLRVIPWNTASRYRDTIDPAEVARTLNVEAALTMSLRSDVDDERLMVTVELVEAASGLMSWTAEFEEPFDDIDIFGVQTRIAQGVAASLGQELTGEVEATLAMAESSSVEAYEQYLQGAEYLMAGDQESLEVADLWFTQAVDTDPNLAEARVGLGTVYLQRFWHGWRGGPGNLPLAEASYDAVLARNPADIRARRGLVYAQFYRGQTEVGLQLAQEAPRPESNDIETLLARAEAYTMHGLDADAEEVLREILVLDPGNHTASWLLVLKSLFSERYEETLVAADTYEARFGHDPYVSSVGAYASGRLGDIDGARDRYDRTTQPLLAMSAGPWSASWFQIEALATSGVFYNRHGPRDRAQAVWQKGLELTQAALAMDADSIGMRVFLASFHAFLGERAAFEREEANVRDALAAVPELNPYEFLFLIGAYAHLGDTEGALEILREQFEAGRLMGLGYLGTIAPTVLDAPAFADFRREYEAEKQRLRGLYGSTL